MPDQRQYAPDKYPFKRMLYKGMKGREVEVLQDWLDNLNDYYQFCKGKSLNPTGYFGQDTKYFVTLFQIFVELYPADGIYDYRTHNMLQWRYYNMMQSTAEYITKQNKAAWNK